MRSTPTPYDTLRTVKVELRCPRFLRMTTPSKIWIRSLSPSLIFVCTRTVSPTRNAGTWPRASGFTFFCSTSSIAFARIFAPLLRTCLCRVSYCSLKTKESSSFFSLEQAQVLGRQVELLEQVRAPFPRAQERLPPAPARDAGVVPAEQRLGNARAPEFGRTGVLRPLQHHLGRERLAGGALLVAQDAGQEPRDRLGHRHRRHLASLEDEVAQGELLVHEREDPLVHPLVPPAHQDQPPPRGELLRLPLVEARALRREQHDVRPGELRPSRLDGGHQRLRLHDHAGAAAVRYVVGDAVLARREVPDVHDPRAQEPLLLGLAQEALRERHRHHAGKQGQ